MGGRGAKLNVSNFSKGIFPKLPKDIFLSGNLPKMQFPKWLLPKSALAQGLFAACGASEEDLTQPLGSCGFGNWKFGKLPLKKSPRIYILENT